jgi:hypothetical protein
VKQDLAKARAEAMFKRKEEQAADGARAWVEYQAERRALEERTERLRALRLAREPSPAATSTKGSKTPTYSARGPRGGKQRPHSSSVSD